MKKRIITPLERAKQYALQPSRRRNMRKKLAAKAIESTNKYKELGLI